jgi:pyruvate/2-oxoglutarate/acetoin dehydrogenase E1 component
MTIMTYRQALHDTLRAEMLRDEKVFLIGEEIGVFEGSYKVTAGLLSEFGEKRVRDTPIAEEGFTGAAIGAAMLGLRPVVEIMTINFSLLALDQIVNHAAKIYGMFGGQARVPLVIRTPGGGGQQLGATHSQNIELYYAFVPGMKVVAPSTPADAKALLLAAIRDDDPVLFLENLALYNTKGKVPDDDIPAQIGKAPVTRKGRDITLIGYSRMAHVASLVAEHPRVNVSYIDDSSNDMLVHHRINIGVAVASEHGLVVPVIEDADQKSVSQLGTETKHLVSLVNAKKLTPEQLSGGTFTISNLGMFGVEHFTAIINPPEAAILAVGGTTREPVIVGDDIAIRHRMRSTLSADHRVIDGALAAQFLQTLTRLIEHPWIIVA